MPNYQKTKRACYMGFITQAIAANFAPLLFLKFHTDYHISLGNIALISTCFFFTQLLAELDVYQEKLRVWEASPQVTEPVRRLVEMLHKYQHVLTSS